jgi:hypothetical protein
MAPFGGAVMGQKETSDAWFKRGFWFPKVDPHRGKNEGLSPREIRSLNKENSKPWGQSWWATDAVTKRATRAQKGRKAVARAQKNRGKAGKPKGWFD